MRYLNMARGKPFKALRPKGKFGGQLTEAEWEQIRLGSVPEKLRSRLYEALHPHPLLEWAKSKNPSKGQPIAAKRRFKQGPSHLTPKQMRQIRINSVPKNRRASLRRALKER
jgi:hypothetical protein